MLPADLNLTSSLGLSVSETYEPSIGSLNMSASLSSGSLTLPDLADLAGITLSDFLPSVIKDDIEDMSIHSPDFTFDFTTGDVSLSATVDLFSWKGTAMDLAFPQQSNGSYACAAMIDLPDFSFTTLSASVPSISAVASVLDELLLSGLSSSRLSFASLELDFSK